MPKSQFNKQTKTLITDMYYLVLSGQSYESHTY